MNFSSLLGLANLLTLSRLFLIPFFIYYFQADMMVPALIIFLLGVLTDQLDGIVARRQGETSFGKFMDPIADKLLVGAVLICFAIFKHVEGGLIPIWMVAIIIGFEVLNMILRVVFIKKHKQAPSPHSWGRLKMISQVIVISFGLVAIEMDIGFVVRGYGPIFFLMFLPLILSTTSSVKWGYRIFGGRDV